MNIAQLRAFHAVAVEGGFTAAARALHVTQPTISGQVRELEDRYAVRLFERTGRAVALSDTGAALLEVSRRLFSLEEQAEEVLSAAQELRRGRLRIGADGPHHVIPLLARFNARHPGIDLSLEMGSADRVLRLLRGSRIDVAVVARAEADPRFHAQTLGASPLVLLVSTGHRWAARRRVRLEALASERVILREAASVTRQVFESTLAERGVALGAAMQIESREAVREAVAAGLGVGVVAEAELDPDPRLRVLAIAGARAAVTEHVVCLAERRRLRVVSAFLELARAPAG